MKILVLSDTHGDTNKAEEAIRSNREVNLIIHLGDYFRDAQKLSSLFPEIPIEYIYGNSDFMIEDVPAEKMIEVDGKRIFITHGHRYSVKWDYDKLYRKAEEMNADLLLFGHTHVADIIEKGGYCVLNPGSTSDPRDDSNESYAIIEIDNGRVAPRLCYF
ncbi:MAG: YfcE family phosphodiesterase [Clostridiales bacterium GWC2_40_7]|nr:MAG: YfcE family phosphodiesterase [Clostridiales bacterium GWC2_40_7]